MAPSATIITEQHASIDTHRESLEHHQCNQHGKEVGKKIIKDAMIERINGIDLRTCNIGEDDAFFVADVGEVYRQHLRWKMNLKRVKPHFGTLLPRNLTVKICLLTPCSCQVSSRPSSPSLACRTWHGLRLCVPSRDQHNPVSRSGSITNYLCQPLQSQFCLAFCI